MSTAHAVLRAEQLLEVGRTDDALGILASHLASEPQDGQALRLLTLAHFRSGATEAADEAVQAALAAEPDDPWGHRLASVVAGRAGRHADALQHAEQAVRLDPQSWQARVTMSHALLDLSRTREGYEQARTAVALAPEEASAHLQLSVAADVRGRSSEAARALGEALQLDPNSSAALNLKAGRELERGRLGDAAQSILGTLRMDPTDTRGHDNLGWLVVGLAARSTGLLLVSAVALTALLVAEYMEAIPAWWPRALAGLIILVIVAADAARTLRFVPQEVRRHVWRLPRTFRGRQRAFVLLALGLAFAAAWLAFMPSTVAQLGALAVLGAIQVGFVVAVGLPVVGWARRLLRR